jgi:hypothetical protein
MPQIIEESPNRIDIDEAEVIKSHGKPRLRELMDQPEYPCQFELDRWADDGGLPVHGGGD